MRQECEFPPRTCCGPSGSSGPGGAGTPLWSAEHGGLHGQARSKSWSRGCTDCSEPSRPSVLSWPACTSSCTACRHRGVQDCCYVWVVVQDLDGHARIRAHPNKDVPTGGMDWVDSLMPMLLKTACPTTPPSSMVRRSMQRSSHQAGVLWHPHAVQQGLQRVTEQVPLRAEEVEASLQQRLRESRLELSKLSNQLGAETRRLRAAHAKLAQLLP
ncbi:hypothetical protein ACKKBF_B09980 [Auxenochlorella protothecoides x Auxenochlorella symbiontica]